MLIPKKKKENNSIEGTDLAQSKSVRIQVVQESSEFSVTKWIL